MSNITNELMYELMKRIHSDIGNLKESNREIRIEMNAMRGTMVAIQQDIHNIYARLGHHEDRLERIEKRLELREFAEPQRPFDPHV